MGEEGTFECSSVWCSCVVCFWGKCSNAWCAVTTISPVLALIFDRTASGTVQSSESIGTHLEQYNIPMCVRVLETESVCMCVSVCERVRERERDSVCVCVCEKAREKCFPFLSIVPVQAPKHCFHSFAVWWGWSVHKHINTHTHRVTAV